LKLAIGKGNSLVGRLLLFNALDMKFRELKLAPRSGVPHLRRASDHQRN